MKTILLTIASCLICTLLFADTKKVLFIGNSYTAQNNLPELVKQLALAGGDTLIYESITPGGATLEQHASNPATINTILSSNWDFVVLQEQSQRPSFSDAQVADEVFPYASYLDSIVKSNDDCIGTVYYMTWGRKNGDAGNCAVWPPVCTYEGMDSLLQLRYTQMAEQNGGIISPAAPIWRHLRNNYPNLELYEPDESHPSAIGSYAAAAGFYNVLFKKSPLNNSYHFSLSAADAQIVQQAVHTVVHDSLSYWRRFSQFVSIDYINVDTSSATNTFGFGAVNPNNVIGYEWTFGDGSSLNYSANPSHTYQDADSYQVCLKVVGPCDEAIYCLWVQATDSTTNSLHQTHLAQLSIYPNPTNGSIFIDGLSTDCNYTLSDISGRHLMQGVIHKKSNVIDMPITLPSGVYLLRLTANSDGSRTFKITVR